MKISIASYSFHGLLSQGMMDVFGYLETCKYRYHIDAADIWNGFLPTLEGDFLKKLKAALDEREMVLANLCVDGPCLWDDSPDAREQHYQEAMTYLRAAQILGAQTIRIDAGGKGDTFSEEQFDLIVKRYTEYAQCAYDMGFKVGPENHWGPEVVPANMKRICEAVNHPGFGVLLHFGRGAGEAGIAPYAMHTHISYDAAERCLEESLAMMRSTGYTGYYSIEHGSAKNEYTEAAIPLARVRDQLSRY